jgi:hypothetical protein
MGHGGSRRSDGFECVARFANQKLRVHVYMTINEFQFIATLGYQALR